MLAACRSRSVVHMHRGSAYSIFSAGSLRQLPWHYSFPMFGRSLSNSPPVPLHGHIHPCVRPEREQKRGGEENGGRWFDVEPTEERVWLGVEDGGFAPLLPLPQPIPDKHYYHYSQKHKPKKHLSVESIKIERPRINRWCSPQLFVEHLQECTQVLVKIVPFDFVVLLRFSDGQNAFIRR